MNPCCFSLLLARVSYLSFVQHHEQNEFTNTHGSSSWNPCIYWRIYFEFKWWVIVENFLFDSYFCCWLYFTLVSICLVCLVSSFILTNTTSLCTYAYFWFARLSGYYSRLRRCENVHFLCCYEYYQEYV